MDAVAVLERLKTLGVSVKVTGDKLRMEPGSKVPESLLGEVKACKPELLNLLAEAPKREAAPIPLSPEAEATAEEIDALCALGRRLQRGEIKALRCGKNGTKCYCCGGVPCRGSVPWREQ